MRRPPSGGNIPRSEQVASQRGCPSFLPTDPSLEGSAGSTCLSVTKSHMTPNCDSRTGPVFRDPFSTQIFNGIYLASLFSPLSIPLGRHQLRRQLITMSLLLGPFPQALVPSPMGRQDYFSSSGRSPKSWHCSYRAVVRGGPSKFTNMLFKAQHPAC